MTKIAIIGAGNMGSAIAAGLSQSNYEVVVANPHADKLERLAAKYPAVAVTTSNAEAAAGADIVFIATRPAQCTDVIAEVSPALSAGALVVTLAPQVGLADIRRPAGCHAARMMPNTAISVGESMTFVCFSEDTGEAVRARLLDALSTLGQTAVIDEKLMGPATALCSCGLAYALRYVRAATEGAVAMGFRPSDAVGYICATLQGAAAMLEQSGGHPEKLVDQVTTPGGTTIRGLLAMERAGFSNAVIEGLLASCHE